ncbi:hypothetical protein H4S06_003149 [Coemansia sp. BCRC 34490]|nr:hypothetical protein H4S06_003149 [Coemansia sp. BCRC 34490]
MASVFKLYVPAKRRLAPTDPFFDLGNAEAGIHHINKQLVLATSQSLAQGSFNDREDLMDTEELLVGFGILQRPMVCDTPPCLGLATFPTTLAFEKHYDQVHQNMCSTCSAVFPSPHWLDLHIQETHDAFFTARIARGDKAFQCFLPSCSMAFALSEKRRLHMIDHHQYPCSFNWMLVCNGNVPARANAEYAANKANDVDQQTEIEQERLTGSDRDGADMDVDQLIPAFKKSARVGAPKSISFGQQDT